ncbi:MAG TPA: tetratricopeptide repeat protein, partial [Kofleriaceae bacterium]
WEEAEVASLASELVATGLATANRYNHLSLDPALGPYLRSRLDDAEREALIPRWNTAMRGYVELLEQQRYENTELAATLTLLELQNLFALLAHVSRTGDAEAIVQLATRLHRLLSNLGRPRLVARVAEVRDGAAARMDAAWNHARFDTARSRIEEQLAAGRLREALGGARDLLHEADAAGEHAYPEADYDRALAGVILCRVLNHAGSPEQALLFVDEAKRRFEAIEEARPGRGAARMAFACLTAKADCLTDLGRLDEAAAVYEECIRGAERGGDKRGVAVGKGQLASVRSRQGRYREAIAAYVEARDHFTALREPGSVAVAWHQMGIAYRGAGQPEAAEDAFRRSLALEVQLGNVGGQASTLGALGTLYDEIGRLEEAASFHRRAAESRVAIGDVAGEGRSQNNLADTLRKLGRLDEARQAIRRAIECRAPLGNAAEPWTTWAILANIEADDGNASAAAEARTKAVVCYLAYRGDGGENHNSDGRISLAVTEKLLAGDAAGATSLLNELSTHADLPVWLRPLVTALQSIAAGSRDRRLADAPELHPTSAAELLHLVDVLDAHERARSGR